MILFRNLKQPADHFELKRFGCSAFNRDPIKINFWKKEGKSMLGFFNP